MEDKYTIEQIVDAITQADDEIVAAIQYQDADMVRDVLMDYLRGDVKAEGELVNVTLVLYFEVKNSEVYGGDGTVGYAEQRMDLETNDLSNVKLLEASECATNGIAELCKVPAENVRIISRTEYEDNTDDD